MSWIEKITGPLEDKRQFRADRTRMEALPQPYKDACVAVFRYLMRAGGISDGDTAVRMMTDLVDLFERASVDGTALEALLGEDPVEFIDEFLRAYDQGSWPAKERGKLRAAIRDAGGEAARVVR